MLPSFQTTLTILRLSQDMTLMKMSWLSAQCSMEMGQNKSHFGVSSMRITQSHKILVFLVTKSLLNTQENHYQATELLIYTDITIIVLPYEFTGEFWEDIHYFVVLVDCWQLDDSHWECMVSDNNNCLKLVCSYCNLLQQSLSLFKMKCLTFMKTTQ